MFQAASSLRRGQDSSPTNAKSADPLLNLLGCPKELTEAGKKPGRSYDETLVYGAYSDGYNGFPSMTLSQIDALQTKQQESRQVDL
ncbi:hypothetical protein [Neoaquamicrobium sediminum]|uniref:hypothetical protein n=1 Tax=Neoaquamicrobium sediminum TaxID=1849104 RepID=UPI004037EFB5